MDNTTTPDVVPEAPVEQPQEPIARVETFGPVIQTDGFGSYNN